MMLIRVLKVRGARDAAVFFLYILSLSTEEMDWSSFHYHIYSRDRYRFEADGNRVVMDSLLFCLSPVSLA